MSYTTLGFFIFIVLTILVYFLFPAKKYKWVTLLVASYVFYLFAGYKYAVFIIFTTLSTYGGGLWLDKISGKSRNEIKIHKVDWSKDDKKRFKNKIKIQKRLVISFLLVVNFGILAFLKYYNFLASNINDLLGFTITNSGMPIFNLVLPLGISFYTFQSMGYIIDVYREKFAAERNVAKFALFVSFFPQIIQGPISFYDQLAYQLYEPHSFDFTRFKHGLELVLWGYFKKIVVADRAVIAINTVIADYTQYNGTTILFVIILYALQLYADFSAGIDISRGIAQIFGIDMVENFKRPYFSKNINEYWRRWHITLGAWMKNYLFYPLAMSNLFIKASKKMKGTKFGASKAGAHIAKVLPTSIASIIVFFMVGIWHGANWKYVGFGLWNGLIIMISILLAPVFAFVLRKLHINPKSIPYTIFQIIRTFVIVLIGYVFDIAPSFSGAIDMMRRTLFDNNFRIGFSQIMSLGISKMEYFLLALCTLIIFIVSVIQERHKNETMRDILDRRSSVVRIGLIIICFFTILIFGIYGPGYDPADFVYMQF